MRTFIIDPHGFHLGDALPTLRGLADFTEQFGDEFHRVESVAKMRDGRLRVLDLKSVRVRQAVRAALDAEDVYIGEATDY